jgi:hypothetical protein
MKNLLSFAVSIPLLVLLAAPAQGFGGHQHVQYTTYGQSRFQHIPDHFAAHNLANQLTELGCAAHVHHNGSCFEVHYACQGVRLRTFARDYDAHQFANWLRSLGFAIRVVHH